MLSALSICSNILKLSSLFTSSFSVQTEVCLGVLLPVNSVHVDVPLPLLSTALVQLALHAATDAPEDPDHGCQEPQHDHDVGRDRPPGEGSVLGPQVDPTAGQRTSPSEQDDVSLRPQMLLNVHDLLLIFFLLLSRETGLALLLVRPSEVLINDGTKSALVAFRFF